MKTDLKSMNADLEETANRIIRDRVSQWVRYTFEKEWLPYIVDEIKEDMHVQIKHCANAAGFKVDVTYTPKPKDDAEKSK